MKLMIPVPCPSRPVHPDPLMMILPDLRDKRNPYNEFFLLLPRVAWMRHSYGTDLNVNANHSHSHLGMAYKVVINQWVRTDRVLSRMDGYQYPRDRRSMRQKTGKILMNQ